MVFLTKIDCYQKMCDKNKNVIKMGMIIKGVYYKCYLQKITPQKSWGPFFLGMVTMNKPL
jgi:hypothetical protein